ncbi:MAG: HAMP domain-containing sensor histidine kinase, partial [Nitriliruptorales bacterium]|nr:HAMP domain-containing sensor histidine kinase [Nitriliruptorales bacterium]
GSDAPDGLTGTTADDPATSTSPTEHEALNELSRINNLLVDVHRQLAAQTSELERANRRKNELLGMAAHDLRNPIGTIQGYAETLHRVAAGQLGDYAQLTLGAIERNTQRMLRLVNDLLQLSELEDASPRLHLSECDLAAVARRVVDAHRLAAQAKDIDLQADLPEAPVILFADIDKIEQVTANLVSNAIKYTPASGRVEVEVEQDGELGVLRVRDNGLGIPADEQGRLFEPFVRLSPTPTGGESSTGLGLAIVRRLVEAHEGEITVRSASGTGSTFTVRLPLEFRLAVD